MNQADPSFSVSIFCDFLMTKITQIHKLSALNQWQLHIVSDRKLAACWKPLPTILHYD